MQITLSKHGRIGSLVICSDWTEAEFEQYTSEFCDRIQVKKIEAPELLQVAKRIENDFDRL